MYKIRHIKTGKYLSGFGKTVVRYAWKSIHYTSENLTSRVGIHWATEYGVNNTFEKLNTYFPGEFEIVKYVIKEV